MRDPQEIFAEVAKRGFKAKQITESDAVRQAKQQLEVSEIVKECHDRFALETAKQRKRGVRNKAVASLGRNSPSPTLILDDDKEERYTSMPS